MFAQEEAQPGKAFRIEDLQCKGISCDLRQGYQAGLTTVEAHGAYRGVDSVRMKLLRRDPKQVLEDRKIGVMSNGRVTISVPAYRLPDGDYVIQVATEAAPRLLAVGTFRKASGEAPPAAEATHSTAPAASTDTSPVGEWRGIRRTGGVLVISADGKYTINGGAGEYRVSGNQITFTGPLSIWNGGRATLKDGTIEFSWTNPHGAKRSYAFAKAR